MNPDDVTPLATRDADPLVDALLRAGRRERAPKGAERRLLAVLGVGGPAGGLGTIASVARLAARLGPKGMLLSSVVAAAVIVAGVWSISRPSRGAPAPAQQGAPAGTTQVMTAAPEAPAAPSAPTTMAAAADVPVTRIEDLPSSSPPAPGVTAPAAPSNAAKPSASASADVGSSLAREVELVEAARSALARGDAAAALRSLDLHDREIPAGTLLPESRVLRIEALVRAGGPEDLTRASSLGDAFLSANPTGPQARRVRTVLGRAP